MLPLQTATVGSVDSVAVAVLPLESTCTMPGDTAAAATPQRVSTPHRVRMLAIATAMRARR